MTIMHPRYRDRFAATASLTAIEGYLDTARKAAAAAERDIAWLTELLATRTEQINAGTWPAPPHQHRGDSMRSFRAHLADPTQHDGTVEPVTIVIDAAIGDQFDDGVDYAQRRAALYDHDAETIAEALWASLPGGTIDQLMMRLLQRRASMFRVRFPAATEEPSEVERMGALLTKVRDYVGGHGDGEVDVWSLREILAGREVKL